MSSSAAIYGDNNEILTMKQKHLSSSTARAARNNWLKTQELTSINGNLVKKLVRKHMKIDWKL